MSLTKDQVIGLLREKGIEFTVHEHAAVMTVDAQVHQQRASFVLCVPADTQDFPHYMQTEALGSTPGVVVKNLFVKVRHVSKFLCMLMSSWDLGAICKHVRHSHEQASLLTPSVQ